jgi:hypothetical protein
MNQPIEGLTETDSGGDIKSSSELSASPNIPIGCPVSEPADYTSETSETKHSWDDERSSYSITWLISVL